MVVTEKTMEKFIATLSDIQLNLITSIVASYGTDVEAFMAANADTICENIQASGEALCDALGITGVVVLKREEKEND